MHRVSIYAKLRVKYSRRANCSPRVARPWRPRAIAWAGPDAFSRDRFYELDSWYKARIQKPELLPKLHVIDPDLIVDNYEDKIRSRKERTIDIGFKRNEIVPNKMTEETKNNLEELAVMNQLLIDLDAVESSNQLGLAEHFSVFEDLFMPGVFFNNVQSVEVIFGESASREKMLFGNTIRASTAARPPVVTIERPQSGTNALTTMLLLNLEGPGQQQAVEDSMTNETSWQVKPLGSVPPSSAQDQLLARLENRQLLHWMVANIPDGRDGVDAGHEVVPYLQPVPFYGTGYHRFAFLLFRHRQPIDVSDFALKGSDSLIARTFSTNAFYKQFEDRMSPSALRFCQIKWDESCDQTLHGLGFKSPRYWYEWNKQMSPDQKEYPMKPMPFHYYLDMYRNPETVRREVQRKRLEKLVKLKPGEKLEPEPYPDIDYMKNWSEKPFFEHERLMKENVGEGVWAALYSDYENPMEQHDMAKYRRTKETEPPVNIFV
uniref:Large ribosomal subunit protein mL38 n=1 Tax=Globodera pallida TaxID=36090 RepID=A0A183CBX2_GLOPA